jgi:formate-dependent nitrite reductase membrane component NrfD
MTQELTAPGYYGLPILKKPFWKWEIAGYFFFEGISAGTYILCAMAEFTGNGKFSDAIARGRYLSFLTLLPCPPLLIADLGRPERFHHMLRIFKRTSPMNHGAWALTGYGLFCGLGALQKLIPQRLASVLGMPFALTMMSYPGVLLSTTAIPVWSHTNFLGPLFAASSTSTAAAALTVLNYRSEDHQLHRALSLMEDVAAATEAAAVTAYVASAQRAARPLTRGRQSKLFAGGAVLMGIVLPALLRRSKSKPVRSLVAPLLTLAGGLALKWSVTYAGQESVLDTELAVHNSPAKTGEPFWGPPTAFEER